MSNTELLRRSNMEPVDVHMRRLKWGRIGYILRKHEKCIARKAMEWNPLSVQEGYLAGPEKHGEGLLLESRRSSVNVGMS